MTAPITPSPRPWSRRTPADQVAAVRLLLAEGYAVSTITFALRAPKADVARISALIRRERAAIAEQEEVDAPSTSADTGPAVAAVEDAAVAEEEAIVDLNSLRAIRDTVDGETVACEADTIFDPAAPAPRPRDADVVVGADSEAEPDAAGGSPAAEPVRAQPDGAARPWRELTAVEKDAAVAELVAQGLSLRDMARRLDVRISSIRMAKKRVDDPRPKQAKPKPEQKPRAEVPVQAEPLPVEGTRPDWTRLNRARRAELLEQYCRDGLSGTAIAMRFVGASRNAIGGAVHRMQLRGSTIRLQSIPARHPAQPKPPREPRAKVPRVPVVRAKPAPLNDSLPVIAISAAAAWDPLPGVTPVHLVDIRDGLCRWPLEVDDGRLGMMCGAPSEAVFCRAHARLACVSPTNRFGAPQRAERTA